MEVSNMETQFAPIPARRHPHQVLMAALLTVTGLSTLLGGARPGSVNAALPVPLLLLWAAVLTVGGAMVVAAAIVKPWPALFLELIADPPLAVMCLVYGQSVWLFAGSRGVVPMALVTAVTAAFAVRTAQVYRTLQALRAEIRRRDPEVGR
jgi:hypothetical protein